MHNFRELEVWKKSIVLCKHYYLISKNFPKDEMLTSQSRRSLYSIPSNIAEGAGRDTNPQFCQFLNMAQVLLLNLKPRLSLRMIWGHGKRQFRIANIRNQACSKYDTKIKAKLFKIELYEVRSTVQAVKLQKIQPTLYIMHFTKIYKNENSIHSKRIQNSGR